MINNIILKLTGWLTDRGRTIPLRRLYTDSWSKKAFDDMAEEMDKTVSLLSNVNAKNTVMKGIIIIEVGKGTPESIIEYLRSISPNTSEEKLTTLYNSMSFDEKKKDT